MMEPNKALIDAIYRHKVLAARAQPPGQKLLAGIRLFDSACRVMADGIRAQHPDADENRVQAILRRRLGIARRLEQET